MQLIDEIIELLSSSKPSLDNALFKAQVLAHKLGEGDLKQWVDSELKGYPDTSNLPPYRVLHVTVMGNFSNGAYRYSEQPLPIMKLDKRLRKKLEITHLTQSIAVIEKWSKSESDLSIVIAPEFYGELSKGLGGGYSVERAWGKHSVGAMLQVIVEVRSRLLDLALQLADRIPREPTVAEIKQVSKEMAVGEIFKNAVFGDNATIVVGSGSIQGVTNSIVRNDFESLASALRTHNVTDDDIAGLRAAIEEDQGADEHKTQSLGPRVRQWIGGMVSKASSAAWQIGIGAAGNILGSAIAAFYGFGA
jgi:AbiTii